MYEAVYVYSVRKYQEICSIIIAVHMTNILRVLLTLQDKSRYYAVKYSLARVTDAIFGSHGEWVEIIDCLGCDVPEQSENDAARGYATDRDVKIDQVRH